MKNVIVDCALYKEGKRVPLDGGGKDIAAAAAWADLNDDAFVWVGLFEPTEEEMVKVADGFDLHPLAVEDAVVAHQRPKLERYGEAIFMVLRTIWYVDSEDAVETGEIAVFVGPHYVVTVRHGEGLGLALTRKDLEDHTEVLGHGPYAVLYSVCDHVVDAYVEVATEIENDVDEIELSVFSDNRRGSDSRRIYTLKREVAEFRRAVAPLREPMTRFAQCQVSGMPQAAAAFFRDVADHTLKVYEQIENIDSLLSSAHDAHMAQISVQQNDDMRKISAWVAIAAVPTALAGIYGMNFDHMPELGWRLGYPGVLLLMALTCTLLYRLFKKSGWL
jgi:magnesium transporter